MNILLIAYDNGSYVHAFPLGLAYLASALNRRGHTVTIYNQDVYHYPEEHLTDYLDMRQFDVVGLGFIAGYSQYAKVLKISRAIKASRNKPMFVLGGHGPTPAPEYFMRITGADAVVMGEGEESFCELVENMDTLAIPGVARRMPAGEGYIIAPRRDVIKDVDSIPLPAWELFPMDHYTLFQSPGFDRTDRTAFVITGRGCPYKCTFCYRMDPGFRPRSSTSIANEVEILQHLYSVTAIMFADELLMSSERRTAEVCSEFLRRGMKFKWYCNGRLNIVTPQILKLMKRAGCVFINYGVECLDDKVLAGMNKKLTVDQIVRGVEMTSAEGIIQGLNVMFGNPGDNGMTLRKTVDFIKKYDTSHTMRTIRPVTPYPGSPLFQAAIAEKKIADVADFYENKHVNADLVSANFTDMPTETVHNLLKMANTELISHYYAQNKQRTLDAAERLYGGNAEGFRGFRQQ